MGRPVFVLILRDDLFEIFFICLCLLACPCCWPAFVRLYASCLSLGFGFIRFGAKGARGESRFVGNPDIPELQPVPRVVIMDAVRQMIQTGGPVGMHGKSAGIVVRLGWRLWSPPGQDIDRQADKSFPGGQEQADVQFLKKMDDPL